jgi:aspartate kinase
MGKTTDELIRLAYQVSPQPNRRELDMLLSTGERVSMALLTMALHDLGLDAISFTGSQAGILTDDSHSSAKIVDIRPMRVEAALGKGQIVVLAGFQGVNDQTKEITTLGRGGSDTTAVAMAARFKGAQCEIIKEVDGVCSADPKLVSNSRVYDRLDYRALAEMCFWGAKVLHYRSVELAHTMRVPLKIRYLDSLEKGTDIVQEDSVFEQSRILAVNSHSAVDHFEIKAEGLEDGLQRLSLLLKSAQLAWPQVLASTFENGRVRMMITSDGEHLAAIRGLVASHSNAGIHSHKPTMSTVTVTCAGAAGSDLTLKALAALSAKGIRAEKTLLSSQSLTIIVPQDLRQPSVTCLHELVTG